MRMVKKTAKAPDPVPPPENEARTEFGARLAGARENAKLTQLQVANFFGLDKATVSAWEKGRGLPDALRFRSLVKLYKTTADALLWDVAVSYEAMQFAAMYEGLSNTKRALLKVIWDSIISDGVKDEDVQRAFASMNKKAAPAVEP